LQSPLSGVPVKPWTLASVDARCFYAPSRSAGWPLAPVAAPHLIRGGLNEPHGGLPHFGVDIEAPDRAPVYAMTSGTVSRVANAGAWDEHLLLAGEYSYWHVTPVPGVHDGSYVVRGQLLGHVFPGFKHVHLSEFVPGCGWVDPRRPTGPLHNRLDKERPVFGELSSFVENPQAPRQLRMNTVTTSLGPTADPSEPIWLDNLHGVVDLRESVSDTPAFATRQWKQLPLMPAAVRGYLAPYGQPQRRIGTPYLDLDGSRVIPAAWYPHVLVFGSLRIHSCFVNPAYLCVASYIFHTSGSGFDTRRVPNGTYLWCVQALTISNERAEKCTPIVIDN
jgi:Peptidase family M23